MHFDVVLLIYFLDDAIKAEAYGFDASGSKYAAFNATKQVVKGQASLESVLKFFGFVTE